MAFGAQIAAAAQRHHLDPRLLAAVAAQETGGPGSDSGRNIIGDGGHGRGIFQIDDRWHPFAQTPAAMDPSANAEYAAGLLAALVGQNGGDVHAALSAFNAGSPRATGTRTTWADGSTLGYADSVLRHYERIGGAAEIATARDSQVAALSDAHPQIDALRSLFSALSAPTAGTPTAPLMQRHPPARPNSPSDDAAAILEPSGQIDSTSGFII